MSGVQRKALIIGIDKYLNQNPLNGCINDANNVSKLLKNNSDLIHSKNFDVCLYIETKHHSKEFLKKSIENLFEESADVALLYFSGHGGIIDGELGVICTYDGEIEMNFIVDIVNNSKVKHKIIIFDCCNSGKISEVKHINNPSVLAKGTTYLASCKENQSSIEIEYDGLSQGLFTTLMINALEGQAANLVGEITPASIYAHIDQSLSSWKPRPVFKSNVESFIYIRKTLHKIDKSILKRITEIFKKENNYTIQLDRSFESTEPNSISKNVEIMKILQKFKANGLVENPGFDDMYYAALDNGTCKLTSLGIHYFNLILEEVI